MPKHIPRSELKVGMVVICGDAKYKPNNCWSDNIGGEKGIGVPSKITRIRAGWVTHTSIDGASEDDCSCSDLDHLYLYESEPMTLETMEVGTIVQGGDTTGKGFKRVLAVLGGEGELKTYVMSRYAEELDNNELKRCDGVYTVFELINRSFKPYSPDAPVEMTMEEINKALGKTVKVVE